MESIALVGAGRMGTGIAWNLLRAGHAVGYLDHPGNADTAEIDGAGAERFGDVPALMAGRTAVILVVTGAPQVEAVVADLLPHLDGAAVIDCSTSLPGTSRRMAGRVEAAGSTWLDAAMTRTPKEAREGRLGLILGGSDEVVARWRPVLESFGESIQQVGGPGDGHAMKLIHNFVSLGFSAVMAEAAAAADAQGIPRERLVEVLGTGGGKSVVLDRFAPWLLEGDEAAFSFTLANAAKDTGYHSDAAGEGARIAALVAAIYREAAERAPGAPVPKLVEMLL